MRGRSVLIRMMQVEIARYVFIAEASREVARCREVSFYEASMFLAVSCGGCGSKHPHGLNHPGPVHRPGVKFLVSQFFRAM